MQGAKNFQATLVSNVRDEAVAIFSVDGMTKPDYALGYDRSTKPALIDLLKSPKKPDDQYALHPKVLFTNYEVANMQLFGSSAISNVGHFCIHLVVLTLLTAPIDFEIGFPWTKGCHLPHSSTAWPKGICPPVGSDICHPRVYCDGCCGGKLGRTLLLRPTNISIGAVHPFARSSFLRKGCHLRDRLSQPFHPIQEVHREALGDTTDEGIDGPARCGSLQEQRRRRPTRSIRSSSRRRQRGRFLSSLYQRDARYVGRHRYPHHSQRQPHAAIPAGAPTVDSPAPITSPPEPPTTPIEPLAASPDQDHPMAVQPANSSDAPAMADENDLEATTKNAKRTTRSKKGRGRGRGARA